MLPHLIFCPSIMGRFKYPDRYIKLPKPAWIDYPCRHALILTDGVLGVLRGGRLRQASNLISLQIMSSTLTLWWDKSWGKRSGWRSMCLRDRQVCLLYILFSPASPALSTYQSASFAHHRLVPTVTFRPFTVGRIWFPKCVAGHVKISYLSVPSIPAFLFPSPPSLTNGYSSAQRPMSPLQI